MSLSVKKVFAIFTFAFGIYFSMYFVIVRRSCDFTSRLRLAYGADIAMPRSSLRFNYPGDPHVIELAIFRPLIMLDIKYFRSRWFHLRFSKSPKPSWVIEADTFMKMEQSDDRRAEALMIFLRNYKSHKVYWLTYADLGL